MYIGPGYVIKSSRGIIYITELDMLSGCPGAINYFCGMSSLLFTPLYIYTVAYVVPQVEQDHPSPILRVSSAPPKGRTGQCEPAHRQIEGWRHYFNGTLTFAG